MRIAIDFDGVIHDQNSIPEGKRMGKPYPGAKEAIEALIAAGDEVTVFSYRAADPDHIAKWLEFFEIPYHDITNIKGDFDVLIDDRAVRFTDWTSAADEIERIRHG